MSIPQKICVVCGLDCSTVTRYQAPNGSYYCQPCYEKLLQAAASSQVPPPSPPSLRVATVAAATPVTTAPLAQPRLQRAAKSKPAFSLKSPIVIAGGVLLLFIALLVAARFVPIAGLVYAAGYGLLALVVGITVLISAFRTSVVQGLLTFFIPFYSFYYVFGISRNRMLMTLTSLCVLLGLGVILLPLENVTIESGSTGREALSHINARTPSPDPESAADDSRKRVVAGYPVTVVPRGHVEVYSRVPGQRQFSVKKDGKTITFRSNKPLNVERWDVDSESIMIINDELFVNFRGYGPLNTGAEILIRRGLVSVGGQRAAERTGAVQMITSQ